MNDFKKSCNDMTDLIVSCWDENNPDDGLTFDERLKEKIKGLTGTDREVMNKVLCWWIFMIFITQKWSEKMLVSDHLLFSLDRIDEETFNKIKEYSHSCINMPNLAKILDVKYNPEHVQLRAGDCLIKVQIKGGILQPYDEELPEDVVLEYYCYKVYSPETHVIIEKENILEE